MERRFSRDLAALSQVFAFVDEVTAAEGLDKAAAFPFRLAIEEVFVNMVKHNPKGTGQIGVDVFPDNGGLAVTLRDPDTGPYDITKHEVSSLAAPVHDRKPGGLGIHLVNRLMDEVSYAHNDREARIRLFKNFPGSHATDRTE